MKHDQISRTEKEDKLLIYLSDKGIDFTKIGVDKLKDK